MKALFFGLAILMGISAANAAPDVIYGNLIIAYYGNDCTTPVAVIPVGSPYVNCDAIPGSNNYVYSIRAQGSDACVQTGSTYVNVICKAYNNR